MWKFEPILVPTIWGGNKIERIKKLSPSSDSIGESWEISGVAGRESVVAEGPDAGIKISRLIANYGPEILGKRNFERFGTRMPLLIKFIDAHSNLSVQVHPSAETAEKLGMGSGKTEMWYVISADSNSLLANGFASPVSPDTFIELAQSGEIMQKLNFLKVKEGDALFIPAGRVHAICGGAFLIEIQQTSDLTFRIYDYGRADKEGVRRDLHTELALQAINFDEKPEPPIDYVHSRNVPVNLVDTSYFTANVLDLDLEMIRNYSELDSFVAIVAISGNATLSTRNLTYDIAAGETVLVAAKEQSLTITPHGSFKAIETFIR